KINALTELKQFELTNRSEQIVFPVHHKVKQLIIQTQSNTNKNDVTFNSNNIEIIILEAYQTAQQMAISVGMGASLIKNKFFDIQQSSQLTKELLKLNSLTESEVLIIEDINSDDEEIDDQPASDDEYNYDEYYDEETNDHPTSDEEYDDDQYFDGEMDNQQDSNEEYYNIEYDDEYYDVAYDTDQFDNEGDFVDESNDDVDDYITSKDDPKPTSSFDNLQQTSYSGVY
ncbi:unnamed protein product, partial [Rotaria sp. Silwood2]